MYVCMYVPLQILQLYLTRVQQFGVIHLEHICLGRNTLKPTKCTLLLYYITIALLELQMINEKK